MAQNKSTDWMCLTLGPPTPSSVYFSAVCVRISLKMERALPIREAGQKNSVVFCCSYPFRLFFNLVYAIKDLVNTEEFCLTENLLDFLSWGFCSFGTISIITKVGGEDPWQSRNLHGRMAVLEEVSQRVPRPGRVVPPGRALPSSALSCR